MTGLPASPSIAPWVMAKFSGMDDCTPVCIGLSAPSGELQQPSTGGVGGVGYWKCTCCTSVALYWKAPWMNGVESAAPALASMVRLDERRGMEEDELTDAGGYRTVGTPASTLDEECWIVGMYEMSSSGGTIGSLTLSMSVCLQLFSSTIRVLVTCSNLSYLEWQRAPVFIGIRACAVSFSPSLCFCRRC